MQALYAGLQEDASTPNMPAMLKSLKHQIDETTQLAVTLIYTITEIARYPEKDAMIRASKHLPTESDLNVNIKLAGNTLLWHILELGSFKKALSEIKPERIIEEEWIRKLYLDLTASSFYKNYIQNQGRERKEEKNILESIFKELILPNESFTDYLEERFMNWQDDSEMMELLILNFLQKPDTYNFQEFVSADKMQYAINLLTSVVEKKEVSSDLIHAKLQNWDPERTALLDMILMRMGICEFLYFETIPPKVTINEYIDLAKDYSTPQSGHFVNGILDSVHKDLSSTNKLHKVSHKK